MMLSPKNTSSPSLLLSVTDVNLVETLHARRIVRMQIRHTCLISRRRGRTANAAEVSERFTCWNVARYEFKTSVVSNNNGPHPTRPRFRSRHALVGRCHEQTRLYACLTITDRLFVSQFSRFAVSTHPRTREANEKADRTDAVISKADGKSTRATNLVIILCDVDPLRTVSLSSGSRLFRCAR